ncbi:PREDICTED: uncharacterized protein LOC102837446 [Chrysochloris asiatica]|uniref:Uncharacterized protein LOC102837446 n=1 Tax=Chrysochloris asiatica TaxID=185453 RepID=A0A9B0TIV6_CHRAS|nr:PREDICTED: uncharacterized protein LOC102837446 [Chrysochloris asiatica]
MSGRHVGRSNTYSRPIHPNNVSFPPRTSGWIHCPSLNGTNSLKRTGTPSGSEFSSCSSSSECKSRLSSPKFPLGRICMGRPYNSKCVETSHLANRPKVARKPASRGSPNCLLCTDRACSPSNPTFLDQLIKGINYLDRSTNSFYTLCPKTALSLPRLAANYLERATNSLHMDQLDHSSQHTYSNPSTIMATHNQTSTSMLPSSSRARAGTLQYMDDATNVGYTRRLNSQSPSPMLLQKPVLKLPELPLFGNGIFSLGRLPKLWEAIRSGWSVPEPISKPSNWW